MTDFTDRIRASDALVHVSRAKEQAEQLTEETAAGTLERQYIERIQVSVAHVTGRLTITDARLIPIETLNHVASQGSRLVEALDRYIAERAQPHLFAANDIVDELLVAARELPPIPLRSAPAVLQKAADAFAAELGSLTDKLTLLARDVDTRLEQADQDLSAHADRIESELASVQTRAQELGQQIEARVSEFTQQIEARASALTQQIEARATQSEQQIEATTLSATSDFERRASEIEGQTAEATERLQRDISNTQENFRQAQDARGNEFQSAQNQHSERFAAQINEQEQKFDATLVEQRDQGQQTLDMLREMEAEARKIRQLVAGVGTGGQYAEEHESQRRTADRWRVWGILVLLLTFATGVWIFLDAPDQAEPLAQSVGRSLRGFALVVTAGVAATYLLRQSGHHRQREEDSIRLANELTVLWPFIDGLPPDQRNALLSDLAPRYFRGGLRLHDPADEVGFFDRLLRRKPSRTGPSDSTAD